MSSPFYQFTLQREKQASYYRFELMVVILHLITFIVYVINRYPDGIGIALLGIAAAVIYVFVYFLNIKKSLKTGLLALPLFVFALFWFAAGVYWMGALVFIFDSFAVISKQKIKVFFTEEGVLYKSFPKRNFTWDSLNNVILKDGMLTIDFKNNKLIQQLVEESDIDETGFNGFCALQLKTLNPKP